MYKVVADSSAEVDARFLEKYPTTRVPFKLYLDGKEYIDDEDLDVDAFVDAMKASVTTPKSACPSPNDFLTHFEGPEEEVYVVTISANLSGTYNSAMLAKKLYESESDAPKKIYVFDSLGAASSETLIIKKIHDLKAQGHSFESVVNTVDDYIRGMRVYFISESLDNLVKNGRIPKWKGIIAAKLHILPIMGADHHGEIKLVETVRNSNKAYRRLIEIVQNELVRNGRKIVALTHVGNWERANQIVGELNNYVEEVINLKCAGLSSLYADKKGVIISF